MKASELRDLAVGELKERHMTLAQEVFNLRFQRAANQLENKRKIRTTRKEIARVLTVIAQKERSEEGTK
jgi:large subunit ribosomal protein L29